MHQLTNHSTKHATGTYLDVRKPVGLGAEAIQRRAQRRGTVAHDKGRIAGGEDAHALDLKEGSGRDCGC
jgi:hypothetical protein